MMRTNFNGVLLIVIAAMLAMSGTHAQRYRSKAYQQVRMLQGGQGKPQILPGGPSQPQILPGGPGPQVLPTGPGQGKPQVLPVGPDQGKPQILPTGPTTNRSQDGPQGAPPALKLRYISTTKYNLTATNLTLAQIADLELAAAKNCTSTMLGGVQGRDAGLGPALYNSSTNYDYVKIYDFASEEAELAYSNCLDAQPGKRLIPPSTGKSHYLGWVPCSEHSRLPDKYAHVYLYGVRDTNTSGKIITDNLDTIFNVVSPCLVPDYSYGSSYKYYPNGTLPPSFNVQYGGVVGTPDVNSLAAYWSYLRGPWGLGMNLPAFSNIVAAISSSVRVQALVNITKPWTSGC